HLCAVPTLALPQHRPLRALEPLRPVEPPERPEDDALQKLEELRRIGGPAQEPRERDKREEPHHDREPTRDARADPRGRSHGWLSRFGRRHSTPSFSSRARIAPGGRPNARPSTA